MQLRVIPPERYARDVLPLTAPLWAGRRSFEEYVAQTAEFARSAYGRRRYRTVGLYDGATLVASFKRYERDVRAGDLRLRAVGIGAVFTPLEYRGRGYASVLLASALDQARSEGYDLAYLFSDIRPQFYAALGFRELPSRALTLRADTLPARRLDPAQLSDDDWNGVRRTFDRCDRRRTAGFARSDSVWQWIRNRIRTGSEHPVGRETNLVVRRRRGISAYVFGVRAPERDAYVVDEYGFADDEAAVAVPALLRAAAGDLRRIVGWLPPDGARQVVSKGSVRKRKRAIFMMAPFSSEGELLCEKISQNANGDFCWATDHI
ncbi:MAG TPA: GNAT family N-acetyltransferase [Candidatus Dormibacteraeota bacterium]|nr:GNAT family N-acetyltransferase [Candidatus Dormibacteraeota bacterium]